MTRTALTSEYAAPRSMWRKNTFNWRATRAAPTNWIRNGSVVAARTCGASCAGLSSARDRRLRDAASLRSGTRTTFIASRTKGSTSLRLPIRRATANATKPQSLAISSELASSSRRRASRGASLAIEKSSENEREKNRNVPRLSPECPALSRGCRKTPQRSPRIVPCSPNKRKLWLIGITIKTWVEIRDPDDKVTMDYVAGEASHDAGLAAKDDRRLTSRSAPIALDISRRR